MAFLYPHPHFPTPRPMCFLAGKYDTQLCLAPVFSAAGWALDFPFIKNTYNCLTPMFSAAGGALDFPLIKNTSNCLVPVFSAAGWGPGFPFNKKIHLTVWLRCSPQLLGGALDFPFIKNTSNCSNHPCLLWCTYIQKRWHIYIFISVKMLVI